MNHPVHFALPVLSLLACFAFFKIIIIKKKDATLSDDNVPAESCSLFMHTLPF